MGSKLQTIEHVLLIDDNEMDNVYHELMLHKSGVVKKVIAMESAQAALDFLKNPASPKIDLILLDINMPGMNGFQFLEKFAGHHPAAGIEVIVVMLTSSPSPADKKLASQYAQIKDYLTKPLTVESAQKLAERFFGK